MNVLILGGGGMIGQKLAHDISVNGLDGKTPDVILHDITKPRWLGTGNPTLLIGDIVVNEIAQALAALKPDVIFFLAAVVSSDAEANFKTGWDVNARGAWNLLEALRIEHENTTNVYRPKIIFTSSLAVFSGPYPDTIDDDFHNAPQSSYGAQKSVVELLISDYSRKGYVDGLSVRLPTICVRPGKPNLAASSFYSSIIREPLHGQEAILPVLDTLRHWFASPQSAVGFLKHAAELDFSRLEGRRALNLPGVSCTVAQQIEALRQIAGNDAVKLIKSVPNPAIANIVMSWPCNFNPECAIKLGFRADRDFADIIQNYIDAEMTDSP